MKVGEIWKNKIHPRLVIILLKHLEDDSWFCGYWYEDGSIALPSNPTFEGEDIYKKYYKIHDNKLKRHQLHDVQDWVRDYENR